MYRWCLFERKGEQLVLFTTRKKTQAQEISDSFREMGLSEISVPRQIKVLEGIPLMGTGKVDYVKVKEIYEKSLA